LSGRHKFLHQLAEGLHQGFALDWHRNGNTHAWPGQSLWARAARIKTRWRRAKIIPGSRIAVSLPNSPAYLAYMLACWMGDWIFCPVPALHPLEIQRRLQLLQPALWVHYSSDRVQEEVQEGGIHDDQDAALILWSSGSMGAGNAYRLSFAALDWQVATHLPALQLSADSLLWNTLPWAHAFAGVLELLPACMAGSVIQVEAQRARHPPRDCTHLLTVPRIARLLTPKFLHSLQSGIIGGAPIGKVLANQLQGTALRVGYGQSEAGPGITLGPPGEFQPFILGHSLVEYALRGETLHYHSPGQADARLSASGWQSIQDDQGWINSGDEVSQDPDGCLFWRGREDGGFSLANGHSIRPEAEEARLTDQYPEAESIILGAPGARHLTAVAKVPGEQVSRLRKQWQEPYLLCIPAARFWDDAPVPQGKPSRRWLYSHWPD